MASADVVKDVAAVMGESEEEVVEKGVRSYVDAEIREARIRIDEIREKYGVEGVDELEEMIERGAVQEHPAWEELIEWRNLKKRIKALKKF
jgi:hypothetical protein